MRCSHDADEVEAQLRTLHALPPSSTWQDVQVNLSCGLVLLFLMDMGSLTYAR